MTSAEPEIERPLPRSGDIVGGKYRLLRAIGGGGMGLVYEATHLRLGQRVAIKFMQPKLVGHAESVARFEREGRAASSLTSPYAARIHDVDATSDGVPYIVSEFLVGRDLRAELEERRRLPIEEALRYVIQACAVMAEAHSQGIIHRDLKPSNLFLAETPTGRAVKVVDFGISKVSTEEELDLTNTGVMLGSPRYMAPEQAQGKPADRRADIWSLGVVLFRALADAYPFDGDTPLAMVIATLGETPRDLRAVLPDAPPALSQAIAKALTRDLDQRFDTMRDFADALAPFASPDMAILAASLTRDVAVPSQRSSERDMRRASAVTKRASMIDTEIAPALDDAAVPIDVEPTEHMSGPSPIVDTAIVDNSGVRAATGEHLVAMSRRRRSKAWLFAALAAAGVVVATLAVVATRSSKPPPASAAARVEAPSAPSPPETAPLPAIAFGTANAASGQTSTASTAPAESTAASPPAPSSGAKATRPPAARPGSPPNVPPAAAPSPAHKNPSYL